MTKKKLTKSDVKANSAGPTVYAQHWPTDLLPLAMFGVNGEQTIAATALKQVRSADFFAKSWCSLVKDNTTKHPLWIGIISYDEFCPFSERKQPSFIYEVHEALVWQANDLANPKKIATGDPRRCALRLTDAQLKDLEKEIAKSSATETPGTSVYPSMSDDSYLSQVHDILSEIRRGSFYQLNLLRYFRLDKNWSWGKVCSRVAHHGGPFSALFRHGNTAVASFSPERFVTIETKDGRPTIHTWPIKGTAPRDLTDPQQDQKAKNDLLASEKDLAELHMIVDLMRNDLQHVCLPKTVEVPIHHEIKSFKSVHHLQSHITGSLNPDITMGQLCSALMPGGSITGAPKREVMKQIRSLEGRERGFVMGNAFVIYSDGSMDSNILIRTLVSTDGTRTWEYAAGSGLVIKSDPHAELVEIAAKCRPITL